MTRPLGKRRAALVLVIGAACLVYALSLRNGFVWDDTALTLRDPLIRSWRLIPEGFRHFLFIDATGSNFYRPIQRLTCTFDYALFAFAPWGYHLTNVLLHAGAAGVLFALLHRLLERFRPQLDASVIAGIVALIWAVHPLHSSAVIYVAGRADLLAALFGFGGLIFVVRERWLGAGICFLAAMLSKESGAMALVLGLAFVFGTRHRQPRQLLPPIMICLAAVGVYSLLRFSAEKIEPPRLTPPAPAVVRPILAARAFAEYAGLFLFPVHLHMERDVSTPTGGEVTRTVEMARMREFQTLLGVLLIVGFCVWLRWCWRAERMAFWALLAFVVAYFPVSNALPLNATVAEHWLYFPSAFLLLAAATSLSHLRLNRWLWQTALVLWIAGLAGRTIIRNADWRDQRTFLESTVKAGGASPRMEINLGALEASAGQPELALAHYQNALNRQPTQPFALLGMATANLKLRRFAETRAWLSRASELPWMRAEVLQTLAVVEYLEAGRDRVDWLRETARLEPRYWPAEQRYAAHLAERGEVHEAIRELTAYLEAQPFRADSWKMLAELLQTAGDTERASIAEIRARQLDVHLHDIAAARP